MISSSSDAKKKKNVLILIPRAATTPASLNLRPRLRYNARNARFCHTSRLSVSQFYDRPGRTTAGLGLAFSPAVPFTFASPFRERRSRRRRQRCRKIRPKGGEKGRGDSEEREGKRDRGGSRGRIRGGRYRSSMPISQPVQRGLVFRRARRSAGAFCRSFKLAAVLTVINKHSRSPSQLPQHRVVLIPDPISSFSIDV